MRSWPSPSEAALSSMCSGSVFLRLIGFLQYRPLSALGLSAKPLCSLLGVVGAVRVSPPLSLEPPAQGGLRIRIRFLGLIVSPAASSSAVSSASASDSSSLNVLGTPLVLPNLSITGLCGAEALSMPPSYPNTLPSDLLLVWPCVCVLGVGVGVPVNVNAFNFAMRLELLSLFIGLFPSCASSPAVLLFTTSESILSQRVGLRIPLPTGTESLLGSLANCTLRRAGGVDVPANVPFALPVQVGTPGAAILIELGREVFGVTPLLLGGGANVPVSAITGECGFSCGMPPLR